MQTLMTSGKDHFRTKSIDPETSKKLFGNLSITDVARAQDQSYGEQFGVSGYEIHPKNRFNFQREYKVPQQKMKRFIDEIIEKGKKIPCSNQYASNQHRKDFFDASKKSKIYTGDRKSAIQLIVNQHKHVPGIGRYNVAEYDEKRCKPPKGTYLQKEEKWSEIDEVLFLGKKKPGQYEAVKLVS